MADLRSSSYSITQMDGAEALRYILEVRRQRRAILEAVAQKQQRVAAKREPKASSKKDPVKQLTIEQIQKLLSQLKATT